MKFKKLLSFAAAVAMACTAMLGSMTITASAAYTSGNLKYYVDSSNKVLYIWSTVEGGATMNEFSSYSSAPWYGYRTQFTKVVIGEGVTSVGKYALAQTNYSATEVVIGADVQSISDYAFYNNTKLKKVTISNNCTSIGQYAFSGCTALTTVQTTNEVPEVTDETYGALSYSEDDFAVGLPSKLTSISARAFYNCSAIAPGGDDSDQYLSIPSTVTTIGDYAFYGCSNAFNTITLNAVSNWGTDTFNGCTSITRFSTSGTTIKKIPDSSFARCSNLADISGMNGAITEIGTNAFVNCTALDVTSYLSSANVTRSNKLTTIGMQAFYGCKGSTNTTLNLAISSLKTIGQSAFRDCTGIETVNFGSSVTSMENYVFWGCTDLTTINNFPTNITEIPAGFFRGCTALESCTIPSQITSIGDYAFYDCTNLSSISFTSYNIKSVGNYAFQNCAALTSLSLPSSVTSIGTYAFSGSGLTSFMVPIYVTSISDYTFKDCTALTSVSFPDDVTSLGKNIFEGCTSLTTVTLPKNLETVTGQTFAGSSVQKIIANSESETFASDSNGVLYNKDMTTLIAYPAGRTSTSFSIPSTVTTIGDYAFYKNTKLTSVTIGSNVETIGNYAFYQATALRSQTIPVKVKSIGTYAYYGDTALTTLTFTNATSTTNGSQCESIGAYAFRNCAFTSLTTPNTLKEIGNYAFAGNTGLKTLTLNSGLETIGDSAFEGDTAITAVRLADTVTTLGQKAFKGCTALKSAKLSRGLKTIKLETFNGCTSLQSANVPSGVETLENSVFYGCTSLEDVSISDTVKTIGNNTFQNCAALKKAVIGRNVVILPTNTFYGCTDENLNIYILGTLSASNALNYSAFGNNASSYVKGNIYVYDDTTFTKVNTNGAVTSGNATLAYAADFTELRETIAEVNSLNFKNYTPASVSVLESNLALAESVLANYASNQGQVDAAVKALNDSMAKLVAADSDEALMSLDAAIAAAEELIESDYNPESYAAFTAAVEAAKNMPDDALPGDILDAADAINEAIENLIPSYAFSDTIKEVYASKYETFLEGTATAKMAGAEKVKVYFDMAPNCAYNQMTEFKFKASVNSVETAEQSAKGSGWPANGTTGHSGTFTLDKPLQEGDQYWFYGYTYNWSNHVFTVRAVELLNGDNEVVFSTKNPPVPNEDLTAAVEDAKAVDTTGWSQDCIDLLNDAIEYAESILAKELPLPSELNSAKEIVEEAVLGPNTPADYSALDEAIANVPADLSKYTDDSVKALNDVLNSIDKNLTAADQDKVDEYVKAVNDAVAALVEKSSEPSSDSSSNPSSEPSKTSATAASTTATPKTTRSPEAVKKDKAAAQKAMKQAKITKLKVKSKAKKKINVTWKKVKKATGYQVQVSAKKNFKKVIFKKNLKKTKLNIKNKKIKSKKTYYVRVRAYATYKDANGKAVKVYSKWNKKLRKVKVK